MQHPGHYARFVCSAGECGQLLLAAEDGLQRFSMLGESWGCLQSRCAVLLRLLAGSGASLQVPERADGLGRRYM